MFKVGDLIQDGQSRVVKIRQKDLLSSNFMKSIKMFFKPLPVKEGKVQESESDVSLLISQALSTPKGKHKNGFLIELAKALEIDTKDMKSSANPELPKSAKV